mmetsp:Transcript_417/g.1264  ORF Transcript_417/g.1264 Transcript_417/m.1264 type:complete len:329 (+) Transcript_417:1049-2035(+)
MAPASTKYLRQASSMPLVVSTTFAPAARIFSMRSLVMSISRCLMPSTSLTSSTSTETPSETLCRCKGKSRSAIFAFCTRLGMPCAARQLFSANPPRTSSDSSDDLPCALSTCTADTGYRAFPSAVSVRTDRTASTASRDQNASCGDRSLEAIEVFAAATTASSPSSSVATISVDFTYFTASFSANRNPDMIVVGWIPCFTSSFPRFSSSAATTTTEVVPSPTSESCSCASSTNTFATGCSTSSRDRIVAPSFVIVMSPTSSTNILSSPTGPSDDLTMFAIAVVAVTCSCRTSFPLRRSPSRPSIILPRSQPRALPVCRRALPLRRALS